MKMYPGRDSNVKLLDLVDTLTRCSSYDTAGKHNLLRQHLGIRILFSKNDEIQKNKPGVLEFYTKWR